MEGIERDDAPASCITVSDPRSSGADVEGEEANGVYVRVPIFLASKDFFLAAFFQWIRFLFIAISIAL